MALPTQIDPLPVDHLAFRIADAVAKAGGEAWMVGGSVRDALLGRPSKDIDLEVHGIDTTRLLRLLRAIGPVAAVGRSFGVFKVGPGDRAIDVAVPRSVGATEGTHRGEVQGDPFMGLEAACRGRDLTLNAIVADPRTGTLRDPTGGLHDLQQGVLRAADSERFADDPLRVVRVARFCATHQLDPSPELIATCRATDLSEVAGERVAGELERALLRSNRPSRFLDVVRATGAWRSVLGDLPDHAAMNHQLDRAASIRALAGPGPRDFALMLSVLFHPHTSLVDPVLDHLRIHRREGFDVRKTALNAIHAAPVLRDAPRESLDTALRTAAESVDLAVALGLVESVSSEFPAQAARARAAELGILHAPLAPLVFGRDLIEAGIPKGPILGRLLAEIRQQQLKGAVSDPESAVALAQVLWTNDTLTRA